MSTTEEMKSFSSISQLPKTASQTSSLRQPSKRMRSSKSSVSIMRSGSVIPENDVSLHSDAADATKMEKRKPEVPRSCECGPDLYSRVLGRTADETILTGLQTVIDLCSKLRVCGDKEDEEEPVREQDLPERDNLQPAISQTDSQKVATSKSQTERSMHSAGFQVNPSVKSVEIQTAPFPQVVSEILQTVGLTPEMVSKVMQTSFVELTEPKKASLASIFMQTSNVTLKSEAMQTTHPDLRSGFVQTSSGLLPAIKESPPSRTVSRQTILDNSSVKSFTSVRQPSEPDIISRTISVEQATTGDEHKCISPDDPPEKAKTCRCCKCSSSSSMRKASKESTFSNDKPACVCGSKRLSKCKCAPPCPKRSRISNEGDQPPPLEVKYAVTRISKYKEFTTFEVMKSTKNQPKQMPKGIEGVFVLKRNRAGSKNDVKKARREGSKGDVKNAKREGSRGDVKGVKSEGSRRHVNGTKKNGSNGEVKEEDKVEAY